MKIGIIGDLHIKSSYYKYKDLHIKSIEVLEKLLNTYQEKDINKVFFLGDIFDKDLLHIETIVTIKDILNSYKDIQFIIIAGNHDMQKYNSRKHTILSLLESENIEVIIEKPVVKPIDEIKTLFVFFPYINNYLESDKVKMYFEEIHKIIKEKKYLQNYKKVFLGHLDFGIKVKDKIFFTPESISQEVLKEYLQGFDLIINGHIHIPSVIETEGLAKIIYTGNTFNSSFGNKILIKTEEDIFNLIKAIRNNQRDIWYLNIETDKIDLNSFGKNEKDTYVYLGIDLQNKTLEETISFLDKLNLFFKSNKNTLKDFIFKFKIFYTDVSNKFLLVKIEQYIQNMKESIIIDKYMFERKEGKENIENLMQDDYDFLKMNLNKEDIVDSLINSNTASIDLSNVKDLIYQVIEQDSKKYIFDKEIMSVFEQIFNNLNN